MKRAAAVMAIVATPALAGAQTTADFARGVDIRTENSSSLYRVALPEDVYTTVTQADLGDLRVFNAAGAVVPHTVRRAPQPDAAPGSYVRVPSFPISARTVAGTDLAAVKIDERGAVLEVRRAPAQGETVSAYLVDLTRLERAVVGLRLAVDDTTGSGFLGRVQVQASDDLTRWQTIVDAAAIARMRHEQHLLTQDEIELQPTRARYLRVMWPGELSDVALRAIDVRLERERPSPDLLWRTVTGHVDPGDDRAAVYEAGGRFPVEQIDLELPDANDALTAAVRSRPDDSAGWQMRYSGLFYSLSQGGDTIRNQPARVGRVTDPDWRLEPSGGGAWRADRLPALKLGWRPDELLFLATGDGPYLLAYGSANVDADGASVDTLLASLGDAASAERIASATVGRARDLAGAAALTPALPWRRIALWAGLIGAVVVLAFVARGTLRDPRGGQDAGAA